MRLARLPFPRHDTVFSLCLSAALAMVFALVCAGCARPFPDLSKVPRAQYSRTVHIGSSECAAWLPLVVRAELGQEYLATALAAAQPWADALGFAVLVPAREGEDATLTVSVEACPPEYETLTAPFCKRLAQTHQECDGGVYRQDIQVFVPGDAISLFYVLMHEVGHALGVQRGADEFGHAAEPADIMFHEIAPVALMEGEAGPDAKVSSAQAQRVTGADAASVQLVWDLK